MRAEHGSRHYICWVLDSHLFFATPARCWLGLMTCTEGSSLSLSDARFWTWSSPTSDTNRTRRVGGLPDLLALMSVEKFRRTSSRNLRKSPSGGLWKKLTVSGAVAADMGPTLYDDVGSVELLREKVRGRLVGGGKGALSSVKSIIPLFSTPQHIDHNVTCWKAGETIGIIGGRSKTHHTWIKMKPCN